MILPNESNFPVSKVRQRRVRETRNVRMVEVYLTFGGPVQTAHEIQESTLACSRFAHKGQPLAAPDLEAHIRENEQIGVPGSKLLSETIAANAGSARATHVFSIL